MLFDTFKFFNVSATFSTGILENRKTKIILNVAEICVNVIEGPFR